MTDDPHRPADAAGRLEPGPAPRVRKSGPAVSGEDARDRDADQPPQTVASLAEFGRARLGGGLGGRLGARAPRPLGGIEKPSLQGASITVGLLGLMAAIELFLTLSAGYPGLRPDQIRFEAYRLFALFPVDALRAWFGDAPIWAASGLATHVLMHGGLMHLLFNGGATLILGPPLERAYGAARYGLLFLATGVLGGVAHVGWEVAAYLRAPEADQMGLAIPLVGASGAVSGLLGAMLAAQAKLAMRAGAPFGAAIGQTARVAIAFVAVNAAVMALDGFVSGAAHLGGFVGGLALGALFAPERRRA